MVPLPDEPGAVMVPPLPVTPAPLAAAPASAFAAPPVLVLPPVPAARPDARGLGVRPAERQGRDVQRHLVGHRVGVLPVAIVVIVNQHGDALAVLAERRKTVERGFVFAATAEGDVAIVALRQHLKRQV